MQAYFGNRPLEDIYTLWEKSIEKLENAKVVVIGVPSDTGAGIRRGAAYGPRAVRRELLKLPRFQDLIKHSQVVDLGDIFCNPHLLHDEMLNLKQIKRCQKEMYGGPFRYRLPVSPLSSLEFALSLLLKEFSHLKVFAIGGDHSIAWPLSRVLSKRHKKLGIVQPDAHTDLLPSRYGVKYCFGTWSFHAAKLIKNRFVQIGIRQSGKDRGHWEKSLGIKQVWAYEARSKSNQDIIQEVISFLKKKGVKDLYFSNDIDGTDCLEAPATGTPVSEGVSSTLLLSLIEELPKHFRWVGADINEVAPDLAKSQEDLEKTCKLAARYSLASIESLLASR
ncbi:MAG: arginase family protein [Bacteriovoracia bacterium]